MPSIEDLKKNGNHISATISMGEPKYDVEIPAQETQPVNQTISIGNAVPTTKKKPTAKKEHKIVPSVPSVGNGERVSADFSSIPKTDGSEKLGVNIQESPQAEIFKEGGMFDQYVKEKVQEVDQWYKEETAKAMKKAQEEEQAKEDAEAPEVNEEDVDTTIVPATTGRVIDISRKEKKPDMKVNVNNNEEIKAPVEEEVKTESLDLEEEDLEEEFDDELEYEDEETEEEEPVPVPLEPGPAIVEPKTEIHNAEEVISTEPIKEEKPVEEKKSSIADKIDRVTRRIMSVDVTDEDFDEDDDEAKVETEEEDQIEILKALVSQKIVPVSKKLDISSFAVAKKATSSNNIFETKEAAIAKWVLPATGITIMLREISGANLETMRTLLSRRIPDMRGVLKIIYDHVVSPKPDSLDAWMKSIAFADYDHLFMAIYIAAFAEANFLPIDCANQECKKPYLTDDIEIMDMVKFKNKEAEEKFSKLYNSEASNPNGLYVTENVAISEKFAIAFREPSIYSVLIESQYFDDTFNRRYQQTVAVMPYIDQVFYIDIENRRLIPVEFKLIANDPSKTARLKIKKLDAILNTLSVDQNAILATYTQKINERSDWFTYRIPETKCPNCNHVNPAQEDQTASSLVFLRNRLGALATI